MYPISNRVLPVILLALATVCGWGQSGNQAGIKATNTPFAGAVLFTDGTKQYWAFPEGPTNGVSASTVTNIIDGIISSENIGTITNADSKSFSVTDKILLSKNIHPSSDGYEFWDDFNRTVTNSPGVSPSGHTWGFSSASGVNSNVVFVQDGAFKIATNAQAGATYWGITNSNPSTVWNKFKGSFLYREYDANGFEQGLGFILANNYFRGGTNWLHVGINFSGFYVQRELSTFLINEQYPAALEPDVEQTYEIALSGNKLWARVAKHTYFVQNDGLTNYTSFPVVIYEHNMKMTNRPAQYFGEWLSAAAGQFESPLVNMAKPFSYSSNATAVSSIVFSDGSAQTTAASNSISVSATGGVTVSQESSGGVTTFTVGSDTELTEWSGISTNKLLTTNHAILQFASSNNVRVAAGTGGITVTPSGSGGVMTYTISDDDAGGSGGSSNMQAAAIGYLTMTNLVFNSVTNLGTNAVQVWDASTKRFARSGVYGNTTIVFTNMATVTNLVGGQFAVDYSAEVFVQQNGQSVTLATLHPVTSESFTFTGGTTNYLWIRWNGTNWSARTSHSPTTGSGSFVLSNAPSIYAPTLLGQTILGTDGSIRFDEHSSAPATPSSGNVALYAKSDGLLYSKDDAGTETLVSGGSGGGTNFPNVNVSYGQTNLVLSAGVEKSFYNQTNASHGINLNLAVPTSGYLVRYAVSNSGSSDITVTFYTNSVAANPYDIATKTNVNTFTASAAAITKVTLQYLGSGIWVLEETKGPEGNLVAGTGITITSGGVNGLDRTISASSSQPATIQWSDNTVHSPSDSTDYYLGLQGGGATATNGNWVYVRKIVPKSGTINVVELRVRGTPGSGESVTFLVRKNENTDSSTWTGTFDAAMQVIRVTNLNFSVSQFDEVGVLMRTPAWSSNPVSVRYDPTAYVE